MKENFSHENFQIPRVDLTLQRAQRYWHPYGEIRSQRCPINDMPGVRPKAYQCRNPRESAYVVAKRLVVIV